MSQSVRLLAIQIKRSVYYMTAEYNELLDQKYWHWLALISDGF